MQNVLNHFKKLAQIPHCSFETTQMRDFLVDYAKSCGCEVSVDKAGNIHAYKGKPKVCLQSHYDMVCMGKAPQIEVYEENGYLKAKDSSLGADNGMGVSIMMEALKEFANIECLFTNDEEVGLFGANGLEHQLLASKLLNLDHEHDNEVTIGCAGGVDVFASLPYQTSPKEGELYELEVVGFKGGHSGVDILSNPTNAIKTLCAFITQNQGELICLNGGERINSIPKHAKAKVFFSTPPKSHPHIKIQSLGKQTQEVCSFDVCRWVNVFSHGVRTYNETLQIAQTSINLAILKMENQEIHFELFARSNDAQELHNIEFETLEFFKLMGAKAYSDHFYLPWEPLETPFSQEVLQAMQSYNPQAKYYAIHAGLECGIIGSKQEGLECCSIGPNIHNPHSTDERCEIDSVQRITKVVFDLLSNHQ